MNFSAGRSLGPVLLFAECNQAKLIIIATFFAGCAMTLQNTPFEKINETTPNNENTLRRI
jgi:hypothetical protein